MDIRSGRLAEEKHERRLDASRAATRQTEEPHVRSEHSDPAQDREAKESAATPAQEPESSTAGSRVLTARILWIDPDSDTRNQAGTLLAGRYDVQLVSDSDTALDAARTHPPALIFLDAAVNGPGGSGLLSALRKVGALREIPVIFLASRGEEEAQIEGFEAEIDDYLLKPFTTRELQAKVELHLKMANFRRAAANREARLRSEAEVERRRLRELLARAEQSEERFRTIVQTTPECVKIVAGDGSLLHMNAAGLAMVGAAHAEMVVGKNVYALVAPEHREGFKEFNENICRGERGSLEYDIIGLDGVRHHMESHGAALRAADGEIVQLAITHDVTSRKIAEDARMRLAAIVESSEDAIVSKDLNGVVTSWNPEAERMFGYTEEEMIGRPITTIIPLEFHPDEEMILGKIKNAQRIDHYETVRLTKSGERIEVSLSISPVKDEHGKVIGAAKIARDIRKQKRIEHALRTTEKLAAAGRLAATVAHEINNPLEAITNLVYLASRDLPAADKVAAHLNAARRELDRVAHITRQTLGFYRDTTTSVRMNFAGTVDDLLLLYEKRLEVRNIEIVRQYDRGAEITAFAGEIRQAMSNLLTNSMDAMATGGRLVIRIRRTREWKSGTPGVRITIADTGSGIKPADRLNLFQPFFTTKADVGTGLGLWITRGIIDKHSGVMKVKSIAGTERHGTAISIFLPSSKKQPVHKDSQPDAARGKISTEVLAQ
jgi:PAS domain S-box-containing protein